MEQYEIKNENLKKFFVQMATDENLRAKMTEAANLDEVYEIASSVQDGFTKEELEEAWNGMLELVKAQNPNFVSDPDRTYALSNEDLQAVVGGTGVSEFYPVIVAASPR